MEAGASCSATRRTRDDDDDWESDCEPGPVRVSLRMGGGRVTSAETHVGGRWKSGTGAVDLGLVCRAGSGDAASRSRGPRRRGGRGSGRRRHHGRQRAGLADAPGARAEPAGIGGHPRQAVFWLGQAAGVEATRGLDSIVHDDRGELEVRKQAVFALSQRPTDEGVPALIRVVRSSREPAIVRTALFWLGQSEDPRALSLFEEILR